MACFLFIEWASDILAVKSNFDSRPLTRILCVRPAAHPHYIKQYCALMHPYFLLKTVMPLCFTICCYSDSECDCVWQWLRALPLIVITCVLNSTEGDQDLLTSCLCSSSSKISKHKSFSSGMSIPCSSAYCAGHFLALRFYWCFSWFNLRAYFATYKEGQSSMENAAKLCVFYSIPLAQLRI